MTTTKRTTATTTSLTTTELQPERVCCGWARFCDIGMAQGFAFSDTARGVVLMSNIFLSSSFLYLANQDADCIDPMTDEALDDCDGSVYGQKPAALIANIAVGTGILSAVFMPFIGALLDYTHHRWSCGVISAILIIIIQAIQSYTISSTWFLMAILQAIVGFLYEVQVLSAYSYLPEMGRIVGESIMNNFNSTFMMVQFITEATFLIAVITIAMAFSLNDVVTAHVSQALSVAWALPTLIVAWRLFPVVPPSRQRKDSDRNLLIAGFVQIMRTTMHIYSTYKRSLRYFLLAVVFAESAVNSFVVVAVVFLTEKMGFSGAGVGIFFLTSLVATLPGCALGRFVTAKLNPKRSYMSCLVCLIIVSIIGTVILHEDYLGIAYAWGAVLGILLGWYHPTEVMFFSFCLPSGQDSELTGFYVYCNLILGWLPPLVVSTLVQRGVDQKYGLLVVAGFLFMGLLFLCFLPSWECILEDVSQERNNVKEEEMLAKEENRAVSCSNRVNTTYAITDNTKVPITSGDGDGDGDTATTTTKTQQQLNSDV